MVLRLICIFVLCLLAVNVSATTYYVTKSGNDSNDGLDSIAANAWLTVQKACTTLANGDTVLIRSGVYDEESASTSWDASVNAGLRPTANNTTFKGFPGDALPEIRGSQTADSLRVGADIAGRDSTVFDSLRFVKGFRAGVFPGNSSRSIRIKNCEIDSCGGGSTDANNGGIWTHFNDRDDIIDLIVRGCTITNTWTSDAGTGGNVAAMQIYGCDSCRFTNNTMYESRYGIWLKNPFSNEGHDTAHHIQIDSNIIYDMSWTGMGIGGAQGTQHNVEVFGNTIYQGDTRNWAWAISIRDADLNDTTNDWHCDSIWIYNNTIDGDSVGGGITVKQAMFDKSSGIKHTRNINVFNNIIYRPKGGPTGNVELAIGNLSSSGGVNGTGALGAYYEDYNIISGGHADQFHWWDTLADNRWTLTEWRANTVWGDNDSLVDPLFVDTGANNYNVPDSSAAAVIFTTVNGRGLGYSGAHEPAAAAASRSKLKGWKQ